MTWILTILTVITLLIGFLYSYSGINLIAGVLFFVVAAVLFSCASIIHEIRTMRIRLEQLLKKSQS